MIPIAALLSSQKDATKVLSEEELDDDYNSAFTARSGVMFGALVGGVATLLLI